MTTHEATATIKRNQPEGDALITVSVRIECGNQTSNEFKSILTTPAALIPSDECSSLYRSMDALFLGCEGGALSGLVFSTWPIREGGNHCAAYLTNLSGQNLPPDCGEGFAIAASLATAQALDKVAPPLPIELKGWEQL